MSSRLLDLKIIVFKGLHLQYGYESKFDARRQGLTPEIQPDDPIHH
jgi:hypothetical protein